MGGGGRKVLSHTVKGRELSGDVCACVTHSHINSNNDDNNDDNHDNTDDRD